jgi:hypothetical protein
VRRGWLVGVVGMVLAFWRKSSQTCRPNIGAGGRQRDIETRGFWGIA